MKFDLKSLNWSNIVAALFALGIVMTTEPAAAATGLAAMLIVWIVNYIIQTFDWKPRRAWLTNGLYVVALILAALFQTVQLPPFPAWGGDLAVFVDGLADFLKGCAPIVTSIMASAMIFYNAIQPLVFDKLPDLPALLKSRKVGQGMVEYALILVLVAVVVIAALSLMGPIVKEVFETINASL